MTRLQMIAMIMILPTIDVPNPIQLVNLFLNLTKIATENNQFQTIKLLELKDQALTRVKLDEYSSNNLNELHQMFKTIYFF